MEREESGREKARSVSPGPPLLPDARQGRHAVDYLVSRCRSGEGKLTIAVLGPLTDLALSLIHISTLMKILFGMEDFQGGRVLLDGKDACIASPLDAIAKGIGMVHQHFMQVPSLTVAENVTLGIEPGQGLLLSLIHI